MGMLFAAGETTSATFAMFASRQPTVAMVAAGEFARGGAAVMLGAEQALEGASATRADGAFARRATAQCASATRATTARADA